MEQDKYASLYYFVIPLLQYWWTSYGICTGIDTFQRDLVHRHGEFSSETNHRFKWSSDEGFVNHGSWDPSRNLEIHVQHPLERGATRLTIHWTQDKSHRSVERSMRNNTYVNFSRIFISANSYLVIFGCFGFAGCFTDSEAKMCIPSGHILWCRSVTKSRGDTAPPAPSLLTW